MSELVDTISDEVITGLRKGELRYLINGKSCSGKTTLIKRLIEKIGDEFEPLILSGSRFNNFFFLSDFTHHQLIKIPFETGKITIDFREGEPIIQPHPLSEGYKTLFTYHKYVDKNKSIRCKNPILIIDDVESVELISLLTFEKAMRLILKREDWFGGLPLVILGNSRIVTYFDNIFTSCLYENQNNLHRVFIYRSLNSIQTRFSKTNPSLENLPQITFQFKQQIKHRAGLLEEKDKLFFKERDVELNRQDLYYETYFTDDYKEINHFNNTVLEDEEGTKYVLTPTKLFDERLIPEKSLAYFYKIYSSLLEPLVVFKGAKLLFTMNLPDIGIERGQFGFLNQIVLKDKIGLDENKNIDLLSQLEYVEVVVNKEVKQVSPREIKNSDTGLTVLTLPFKLGYCVHFKYLSYLPKANLLLTKNTNIYVAEACINKINDLGFKNTSLLNSASLFSTSYTEYVKNVE